MKKTEFNELIEKAFSMGYEYAILEVKEFSNKEQKKIRHNYDIARGFKKALEYKMV